MSRILCVTSGLAGVFQASLELARRLQVEGHTLTYACPVGTEDGAERARRVSAAGLQFRALAPVVFAPAPQLPRERGSRLLHKMRELRTRRARVAAGVEALGMEGFRELLAEARPEFLLLDSEMHEHILTAQALGQRFALLEHFFATSRRPGLPPLGSSVLPGRGLTGSGAGLAGAWLRARTARWLQIQRTNLSYLGADRRGVLRAYAKQAGVRGLRTRRLDWQGVVTYPELPTLAMTSAALEFPHAKPDNVHYVGPMTDLTRDREPPQEIADPLQGVLAAAQAAGQRVLFATATTMGGVGDGFADRLVTAVAAHPEWQLVLGLGGASERQASRPPNVAVFPWVPQLMVLAAADLAVVHGGIHTLHECTQLEVPMLAYSGGRFDQNGCAARIAFHGLGVRGDRAGDSPEKIAARIAGVLSDSSVRGHLSSAAEACRRDREERRLEDRVAELLRGG